MRTGSWKGTFLTSKDYTSAAAELSDASGGRPAATDIIIGALIDRLLQRVDLSTGPDKRIEFSGGTGPVVIAHGLTVDGKKVTPRHIELVAFSGVQNFAYAVDDTNITITCNGEATGKLDVYI